jgi:hypothetical protein
MPKTLLLFSIFFCSDLVAQTLNFNNEPVDAIEISAHISARQANGKTSGKQDFYSILFNEQTKSYQLSVYKKTKYIVTFQPPSRVTKIRILSKSKILNRDLLSDLLQSFEVGTMAPNSENCVISKNQFDALTSRKSILNIIKTKKLKKHLSPIKLNNAEIAQIATTAQNLDTFDLYLSTRFANPTFANPVGTDNSLEVIIKTKFGEYQYQASFINPYKQPWIVLLSTKQASMTILNFNIHRALAAILPESFLLCDSLLPEALIEDYVFWCMKRRGFIWEC